VAQHYLLSAEARDISLRQVLSMSDDEARLQLAELRWGGREKQSCPHCGVIDSHWFLRLQQRWRCRHCDKAFSVTSGTVFHHNKLPLQLLLGAIVIYANAVKGLSALQLARDLDIQYKTAFVLLHKLRETLFLGRDTTPLQGEVEIDGGYVHTYVRPKNKKEDRKDTRKAEHQNPLKCVVLVLRERSGEKKRGATRTRTVVLESENERDIRAIVMANVEKGARIYTDQAQGYVSLESHWEHLVVNHDKEYRAKDGANENQSESYIARFRRMLMGQIHRLKRKYLDVYANEVAFREDHRRVSNGTFVKALLKRCLRRGPSRDWSKYWQGNHRLHDSVQVFA
jgi:transposase-like protein